MAVNRNRYLLHKKVARGGMAEIYLGKHIGEDGFERICCIKRILPHFAQDAEFIEMFRDEAHICKRLQHANIVRVEGFEEVEGSYAIIMEYINGGDLRTILSSCERENLRLSVPMALLIIAEAARGLHFAHSRTDEITGKPLNIVHRDISPQNILVSFEGEIKVTDFGIADAQNKATETKPGIVKGKYSYMSPEQITAQAVDARTDVFALAIVLWEMIAMKRLFQGDNEVTTIQLVKSCHIGRDLRELNPDVDDELFTLIHKALAKDPDARFSSAAEFERELRRYQSKTYPDFTVGDFAAFLQRLMHKRRQESQEEIKLLLETKSIAALQDDADSKLYKGFGKKTGTSVSLSIDEALAAPSLRVVGDHTMGQGQVVGTGMRQPAMSQARPGVAPSAGGTSAGTSFGSPGSRTHMGRPESQSGLQRPQAKASRGISVTLVAVLSAVIVLALGAYVYKRRSSGSGGGVEVSVLPTRVKFELDGMPLFSGQYVDTPKNITGLSAGEHRLIMRRRGYSDEVYEFSYKQGDPKKRKDIVLKALGEPAPLRLVLAAGEDAGQVRISIDEGAFVGGLASGASLDAPHFLSGDEITLDVQNIAEDGGAIGAPFRCSFVPRATSWRAPFIVRIDAAASACSYPPR